MKNEVKNAIKEGVNSTVKNWWVVLIVGILYVGVGFWMLMAPVETYGALVLLFSFLMFAGGAGEIAFALTNCCSMKGWGWNLVLGIIDLLIGIYLVCNPALTAIVIPIIIALWLMFKGFSVIAFSTEASSFGIKGWGWYLALGILSVLFSIMIIWNPFTGAAIAVYMTSLAMLTIGLYRIILSLDMKNVKNRLKK